MQAGSIGSLLAAALLATTPGDAPTRDCAFGVLAWCLVESEAETKLPTSRLRLELFGGYKPTIGYYEVERRACAAAGCTLRLDGALALVDVFVRLKGNPRSDDYFDLGLSTLSLPVVTAMEGNARGFEGELGPVAAGDGSLTYQAVRLTLRRPSLFYLLQSKYLISSFGVGVAFPVARGAGASFTGADGVKVSLGGRLGLQVPLTPALSVGLATSYNVVWYGPRFAHVAYVGGYGLNLQWLVGAE